MNDRITAALRCLADSTRDNCVHAASEGNEPTSADMVSSEIGPTGITCAPRNEGQRMREEQAGNAERSQEKRI